MGMPMPVGLIALGVIAWNVIEYRDWVGPVGVAVIWLYYWLVLRSCRRYIDKLKQVGLTEADIDKLTEQIF
jgi:hypothetical protein